jgi:beta-galactosidase
MKNKRTIGRRRFLESSAVAISPLLGDGLRALARSRTDAEDNGQGGLTLSLNGEWEIDDSESADQIPRAFQHHVPVPGLAHLAQPAFPDVDMFDSRENLLNRIQSKELPESVWDSLGADGVGISRQKRNYFWYRKTFRVPDRREVAILKVSKAQFGTAVWSNGKKVGEHLGCFSAGFFDLTGTINWEGENQLLVRVGAHPGVLPKGAPAGTDFEKRKWTPGIYDHVLLLLSDNPFIETLQVAPRIDSSEILVQATVRNYGNTTKTFDLNYRIKTWKDEKEVAHAVQSRLEIQPGEAKSWTKKVRIPDAKLWTPETPFLYLLETSTGGNSVRTRFGMREFRFDTATKRAVLNGKVYFMRGSNITLHRFFEDPKSGALPWDEKWLRKLLIDIPKQMSWNSFRFCIGPVPDQWLDIADEAGLLIQNEFFVWTGHPSWSSKYHAPRWDAEEMIRQYQAWVKDNWNHPSVAIWDANNETLDDIFADKIIPAARPLDLSGRPWENSYNGPAGPNDPVEDHPYLFSSYTFGGKPFKMTDLEGLSGLSTDSTRPASGHAMINNEYGWLWLNRDGSPTKLTKAVYDHLLGPNSVAEERFALDAYLLAGLTEFWRAYRNYAGVLHFVYLTSSLPDGYTSDNFRDVETLELEPHFKDYVGEAFKPVGVYIDFWQPTLEAGAKRRFLVMMINDDYEDASGKLVLSLETENAKGAVRSELSFSLPALGQQTFRFDFDIPRSPGRYLLKATASTTGKWSAMPTVCRRNVSIITKSS